MGLFSSFDLYILGLFFFLILFTCNAGNLNTLASFSPPFFFWFCFEQSGMSGGSTSSCLYILMTTNIVQLLSIYCQPTLPGRLGTYSLYGIARLALWWGA